MMRATFLPFCRPSITEEDIAAVADVLRSGWITTGPKVAELEDMVAARTGAKPSHGAGCPGCDFGSAVARVANGRVTVPGRIRGSRPRVAPPVAAIAPPALGAATPVPTAGASAPQHLLPLIGQQGPLLEEF